MYVTNKKEVAEMQSNFVLDGIMGHIVGDALGVPVEFEDRESLRKNPVKEMREQGFHKQPAGTWSDDSSMTLCTMDSLINGLDYEDIMNNFKTWLFEGAYTPYDKTFSVGRATTKAINNYKNGMEPLLCGGTGERDNGNGSLMRILPMSLYQYAHCNHMQGFNEQELMQPIINVSKLTHAHKISLIACGLFSRIVGKVLAPKNDTDLFCCVEAGLKNGFNYYGVIMEEKYKDVLPKYNRLRDLRAFKNFSENEIKSSGYVIDTLEAVIWCLLNTNSYKESVLKAVNLGADTDTVGAITGGIAGLYYGYNSIPEDWLGNLAKRDWIEKMCVKFYKSLSI